MRWASFLVLAGIFAVLAALWLRRDRALRSDELFVFDVPLLPDFEPDRVASVRVDHLRRGLQLRLERDRLGAWFLTDPLAYPAIDELVHKLLSILARERGELLTEAEAGELGLEPPQAVVELEQRRPDGGPQRQRIELGSSDVDPRKVYVRVPGHPAAREGGAALLRISRSLANTLDRAVDDYRETRITAFLGAEIVGFVRRGALVLPGATEPIDLTLSAARLDERWIDTADGVRLDPAASALLARCAAELRVRQFVDDAPARLEPYGLDDPDFEMELIARNGERATLQFGRPGAQPNGGKRWFAKRSDGAHVFAVEPSDVLLLQRPNEALYDLQILRVLRERVSAVQIERPAGALLLSRGPRGWSVASAGASFPADAARVDDLLARLEAAQIAAVLPHVSFPEDGATAGFHVQLDDGSSQGARLGPPWSDPSTGLAGRLVQRDGESVTGLIDARIADVLDVSLDELRPRQVHFLKERTVGKVTLTRGTDRQLYVRMETTWRPHGLALDASPEVLHVLERLFALRVEGWIDTPTKRALEPAVEVLLEGSFGDPIGFTLGRDQGGRAVCRLAGGREAVVEETLLRDVLALFGS